MTTPDPTAMRVTALVTAFRPDARLAAVVRSAAQQCARVVVVDNTPDGEPGAEPLLAGPVLAEPPLAESLPAEPLPAEPPAPRADGTGLTSAGAGVVLVERSGRNLGLAGALNLGLTLAGDADALLLLDQDSVLPCGLVAALGAHLAADATIGIATPTPWDADAGRFLDPRAARRPQLADLPVAITSGMLVRRAVVEQVGAFREDFFVDCIDQDYCLRTRRAGWRVVQDRDVRLPHSLGETRWRRLGPVRLRSTQHPTWRLYWAARNGVVLARENWRREPAWVATSLALLGYVAVTVLLYEPPRRARLARMLRGARDGWSGRTDPAQRPGGAA